jgi:AdoMet-dependent heme synthase
MLSPKKDQASKALPKLDFNVTNECNFRCIHCCFQSGRAKLGQFSCAKIKKVLQLFKKLGGWRIDITGGEPETRPDLIKIISIAKELNLKTELVTNGSLLNQEKLRRYKDLGLEGIAISLDGSTPEKYQRIRQTPRETFCRVLHSIKESADSGFYTKVNTVVFANNIFDLTNISQLAVSLGAKEHGFYYFSPIGSGQTHAEETADPLAWLKVVREELPAFKNQIKISLETPIIEESKARESKLDASCFLDSPWHLQILPDGFVYPCAIMAAYQRPLANLYHSSLRQIWESKKLWNKNFYAKNARPLFKRFSSCVDYPAVHQLVKTGEYRFVCLCRKFSLEELQ